MAKFSVGATMQDLSDFALPCTVTQVLYNGPMYISPEEDLSSQIFNLGSVGSVLPSDLQGIQADDDGSRKLGLQTANGGRTDAHPVAYPKKECGLAPTDHGPSGPIAKDLSTFSGEERCSWWWIVGVQRSDGTFAGGSTRRVSQPRYAASHRSSGRED